jgi:methylglutaconyl-CoA hydratase
MVSMAHPTAFQTLDLQPSRTGVLTVTLNRENVRNAFNEVLIDELIRVFTKDARAAAVRMVVLRGKGPVFCAGGDLNWMKQAVDYSKKENLADTRKLTKMFQVMNEFPKPLIGVVQGAAIGGGVGLVSVCDIVIAHSETVFSLSEVRLGLVPACIGPFVISKIGASNARALFLSAERFSAKRAYEAGLIHEVAPDLIALEKALDRTTENMLQCSPNAIAAAKKLVLDLSWPERRKKMKDCYEYSAAMLAELRVSKEGQEGVRAFLEKRKPSWIP